MKTRKRQLLICIFVIIISTAGHLFAAAKPLSFDYTKGKSTAEFGKRTHQVDIKKVKNQVFVYATFQMGPTNPITYEDGLPKFVRSAAKKAGDLVGADVTFEQELLREKETAKNVVQPKHLQVITLGENSDGKFATYLLLWLSIYWVASHEPIRGNDQTVE